MYERNVYAFTQGEGKTKPYQRFTSIQCTDVESKEVYLSLCRHLLGHQTAERLSSVFHAKDLPRRFKVTFYISRFLAHAISTLLYFFV